MVWVLPRTALYADGIGIEILPLIADRDRLF